jgi:hypothetical protein
MTKQNIPTADSIVDEINIDQFLPDPIESRLIKNSMVLALKSMQSNPTDYRLHMDNVQKFLRTLWTKYDCQDIIRIIDTLSFVEPPLLDLERGSQRTYREHYVHLFNVFVLGLRVLSKVIEKTGDDAKDLLRIDDEKLQNEIPIFHNYSWKERLFYLWTLMSNFHDISVPVTRLNSISDGLNEFLKEFGLEVFGPTLVPFFPSNLEEFCDILGSLYEGKLTAIDGWRYDKSRKNEYVHSMLRNEFIRRNHGVMSAFLMYEKIKEIFLEGKNKYPLDISSCNKYFDIVLKEDVARAALSISFHDLSINNTKAKYPKCPPVDFSEFPLTYLLILVDCLQEYLRWEGTSIKGWTKFITFPSIGVKCSKKRLVYNFRFIIDKDKQTQEYLIEQARKIPGTIGTINTYGDAAELVINKIIDELRLKLATHKPTVTLGVWDSTKNKELFKKDIG